MPLFLFDRFKINNLLNYIEKISLKMVLLNYIEKIAKKYH